MSEFQINDYLLQKECDELAAEIAAEFSPGTLAENRDDMMDRAHETADGHQWVIYNYMALMLCAHCDTNHGEDFLSDVGVPDEPDIYKLACAIAYGEMRARIETALEELIEADEEPDDEDEDENDAA